MKRGPDGDGLGGGTGAVLRRARQAAGVLQTDLAKTLGISVWTLNRVEHGSRRFDPEWVSRMPASIRRPVARSLIRRYSDSISQVSEHILRA